LKNRIDKRLQFRASFGRNGQILIAQDATRISNFGVVTPAGTNSKYFLDVIGRWVIVIHGFGRARGSSSIAPGDLLNLTPIGQEPSFKIVLCDVRVKPFILPYPKAHFGFSVCSILKIVLSCVYIGQGNYRICPIRRSL